MQWYWTYVPSRLWRGCVGRSEAYGAMLKGRHRGDGPISLTTALERLHTAFLPSLGTYATRLLAQALRCWVNKLLRYCRAGYRGCIFGRDSELHIERKAGLP